MFTLLRQRNFARLWWGGLISITGNRVLTMAIPFYIYELTDHFLERLADLGLVMDDEQLHYCGGAVKGGGKRLSSLVGSARTACNWSS